MRIVSPPWKQFPPTETPDVADTSGTAAEETRLLDDGVPDSEDEEAVPVSSTNTAPTTAIPSTPSSTPPQSPIKSRSSIADTADDTDMVASQTGSESGGSLPPARYR